MAFTHLLYLTQIRLAVSQNPRIPFHGAVLQPLAPQSVRIAKVVLSHICPI